jgi:hypothetical protein
LRSSPPQDCDWPRRKLGLALGIMGVGMLIAVAWAAVQGWWLDRNYPYDTFLFSPDIRFNDYSDYILDARRSNPYLDPFGIYLPFAWEFYRLFSLLPMRLGLLVFLFAGIGGMFVLLMAALAPVVRMARERALLALAFLALSYPVLVAVDRANLELYLGCLAAAAIYFMGRGRYGLGTGCLLLATCFKLYPGVLFLLLVRQRRFGLLAVSAAVFAAVFVLSFSALSLPLGEGTSFFARNLSFIRSYCLYQNYTLEGCASLWNAYKVGLLGAAKMGWNAPVDFNLGGRFIGISYEVYSGVAALTGVALAVYVCVVEREFARCVAVLLLFMSVFTPLGADYRLLYADIALVAVILLRTQRESDRAVLVLLALAMVPKKEIFLAFAGRTETYFSDVSIQVVLNPLLVLAALILLVRDGLRARRPAVDGYLTRRIPG